MTSTKEYPYTLPDGRVVKDYKREDSTYLYLLSCSKCGVEEWGRSHRLSRECLSCRGYVVKYSDEQTRLNNKRYNRTKVSARNRGYDFDLSREDFLWLMNWECFWCGDEPTGVDRLENKVGYNVDNCVSSCKRCNVAKNDMTKDEWFDWISRLSQKWGVDTNG
jgi:hypothetical protein